MHTQPDMTKAADRLAHYLSEIHNDNAPLGWERYRSLALALLRKFPMIEATVIDPKFLE